MTRTLAPVAGPTSCRSAGSPLAEARRSDAELRRIVLRVRQWGLEAGRPCSTDALTAIAGAVVEEARAGHVSPLSWSAGRVGEVLSLGAPRYCSRLGVPRPAGLAPAVTLWLDYLDALDALAPGSDPIDRLRRAAAASSTTKAALRRRLAPRHPAGTGRR